MKVLPLVGGIEHGRNAAAADHDKLLWVWDLSEGYRRGPAENEQREAWWYDPSLTHEEFAASLIITDGGWY